MQKSLEAMETALRVLAAVNRTSPPDPADIDFLRAYSGLQGEGMDADVLACEVIQQALRRRAIARAATRE